MRAQRSGHRWKRNDSVETKQTAKHVRRRVGANVGIVFLCLPYSRGVGYVRLREGITSPLDCPSHYYKTIWNQPYPNLGPSGRDTILLFVGVYCCRRSFHVCVGWRKATCLGGRIRRCFIVFVIILQNVDVHQLTFSWQCRDMSRQCARHATTCHYMPRNDCRGKAYGKRHGKPHAPWQDPRQCSRHITGIPTARPTPRSCPREHSRQGPRQEPRGKARGKGPAARPAARAPPQNPR